MSDADDLADSLRRYDEVVGEYVEVHQRIRDGLPPARRKPRWWLPLAILSVLVLALPLGILVGRAHLISPAPPLAPWPGPTNTGVPPGTTLTAWGGGCVITTDNTVIDSKLVDCSVANGYEGSLTIHAANVTINKSSVKGIVVLDTDLPGSNNWSMSLTDSEVSAGLIAQAAVSAGNLTVLRSNIHGGATSVQCEYGNVDAGHICDIRDSWLHGQEMPDDQPWHLGGFLSEGGVPAGVIKLIHNRVVCDHPVNLVNDGCSGDINLIPNVAAISGVLIQNNILGANVGASFCTYGGERSDKTWGHADHVTYKDNVFERGTNRLCGGYGPVNAFDVNGPGNQWINNTWEDDGTAVPPSL